MANQSNVDEIYLLLLNVKAQVSQLNVDLINMKQSWFQKNSSYIISFFTLCGSFLLSYLGSKWVFKSQAILEENKRKKELEIKGIDLTQKKEEEQRKYYMEASKHQPGLISSARSAILTQISIECLLKKYTLSDPKSAIGKFLFQQIEERRKNFAELNNEYKNELKNFIAALAGYKILKHGKSKITEHIEKITNGMEFNFNREKLNSTKDMKEIDELSDSEKKRFLGYWKTHVKEETKKALDIILRNE